MFSLNKIITVSLMCVLSGQVLADHSPQKMMRNFTAYSALSVGGKFGPFDVNFDKFGKLPAGQATAVENKKYEKFLADKFNLAAIVMRDEEIIFERYNQKRKINSNTPLVGMSMSKTAIGASVGQLLCSGKINSLDDKTRKYSKFLATTPYADISIRNILQMNSGVSPNGRSDEKRFNYKARGILKYEGKADVREAIKFYKVASRSAGSEMNYHSSDSLALSVLVEDIAGQSLAKYFHQNIYNKFGENNFVQWTSDKSGTTVAFSDLVMTARDWANFGQFLMSEKKNETCLGKYFNEGVEKSVSTGKENGSRYGFQSWVFDVNAKPTMVLQGHGGQFMVLDETTNTLLLVISINEKYEAGNLFSNINKLAERLN